MMETRIQLFILGVYSCPKEIYVAITNVFKQLIHILDSVLDGQEGSLGPAPAPC